MYIISVRRFSTEKYDLEPALGFGDMGGCGTAGILYYIKGQGGHVMGAWAGIGPGRRGIYLMQHIMDG